jgi:hypothetical protein
MPRHQILAQSRSTSALRIVWSEDPDIDKVVLDGI